MIDIPQASSASFAVRYQSNLLLITGSLTDSLSPRSRTPHPLKSPFSHLTDWVDLSHIKRDQRNSPYSGIPRQHYRRRGDSGPPSNIERRIGECIRIRIHKQIMAENVIYSYKHALIMERGGNTEPIRVAVRDRKHTIVSIINIQRVSSRHIGSQEGRPWLEVTKCTRKASTRAAPWIAYT